MEHAAGGAQGTNDFKKVGYNGPCPPPGKAHRYFFKLYALDGPLNLHSSATKQDVEKAIQGHVLSHAETMGTYQRK
jgi:Raf kinase inhibitor-like YbhB/YbcL family protein